MRNNWTTIKLIQTQYNMPRNKQISAYPRMWIYLKLQKTVKERGCSVSEIVCEALFQYFNKK